MLFTVYDKKGEPFEVRPDHAKKLVIEQGWSMDPVQTLMHEDTAAAEHAPDEDIKP